MSEQIRYFHPSRGDNGKPLSTANIIWAERDQGSAYYRVSRFAAMHGAFPPNHPCCPGPCRSTDRAEVGSGDAIESFRARGYWASCFPEGDGITLRWWKDEGEGFDSKSATDVLRDIQECFGWKVEAGHD